MEKGPVFLKAVELPEYCFLSEAVEWIALGRVPEADIIYESRTDEPVESRFHWEQMPENLEPPQYYPWFDRSEFVCVGLPIREEYFGAAEKCMLEGVFELEKQIQWYGTQSPVFVEQEDGSYLDMYKGFSDDAASRIERYSTEKRLVEEVEAEFERFLELGWAQIFQWVQRGEVELQGLNLERWEKLSELSDYESAAKFDQLPPKAVSVGLDWRKNELSWSSRNYVSLRLRVSEILDHLDDAQQGWKLASVEQFGMFYRMQGAPHPVRRRGRPSVVDWEALRRHLAILVVDEKRPPNKESCIYELIAFAERKLAAKVSRSSVQRNLGDELARIYG